MPPEPMSQPPAERVLVAVFCYNEGAKIRRTLSRFPTDFPYEVVLMDDGSTDRALDDPLPFACTVLRHDTNRGIGAAIRTVYDHALKQGYDVVVTVAGNDKDDPTQILRLLGPIMDGRADLAQGSRYLPEGRFGSMPWQRVLATRYVHPWLFLLCSGRRLTDTTNGFRAIRTRVLRDQRIRWRDEWLGRYELEPYLLWHAVRLGYKVVEVPVAKVYPSVHLGYSKLPPITGWWSIVRPLILLRLGLKR